MDEKNDLLITEGPSVASIHNCKPNSKVWNRGLGFCELWHAYLDLNQAAFRKVGSKYNSADFSTTINDSGEFVDRLFGPMFLVSENAKIIL